MRSQAAPAQGEREVQAHNSPKQSPLGGSIGAAVAQPGQLGESDGGWGKAAVAQPRQPRKSSNRWCGHHHRKVATSGAALGKRGKVVRPPPQESREKRCRHWPSGSRDAEQPHGGSRELCQMVLGAGRSAGACCTERVPGPAFKGYTDF
ncbi:hypothetical protein TURU_002965 [Turdus rufiventris]|nr:hypothetical protein TURU_002965 [Turdus rufiventris]